MVSGLLQHDLLGPPLPHTLRLLLLRSVRTQSVVVVVVVVVLLLVQSVLTVTSVTPGMVSSGTVSHLRYS